MSLPKSVLEGKQFAIGFEVTYVVESPAAPGKWNVPLKVRMWG